MTNTHTIHQDLAGNNALLASLGFDFVMQELIEVIREGLKRDGLVRLHQFGTFRLRYSKPRQYKHPKTGVTRMLPPMPRVTFKAAKHLRNQIQTKPTPAVTPAIQPNIAVDSMSEKTVVPALEKVSNNTHKKKTNISPALAITVVGLLAAIPFILSVLQDDFKTPAEIDATTPVTQSIASVMPEPDIIVSDAISNAVNTELVSNETTDYQENASVTPDRKPANNSSALLTQGSDAVKHQATDTTTFFLRPTVHKVSRGESLWRLAAKHYNEPLYWPYIYRANQRVLSNPDHIDINMKLVIPGLQHPSDNLSVRDREAIAEGYYLLYEYHTRLGNEQADDYLIGARRFDANFVARRKEAVG